MIQQHKQRRIAIDELRVGMFVSQLEVDWSKTPFPQQGVKITSAQDIEQLRPYGHHVYIALPPAPGAAALPGLRRGEMAPGRFARSTHYADQLPLAAELPQARQACEHAAATLELLVRGLDRGQPLGVEELEDAIQPLVRSVLRNPQAFLWVDSLLRGDDYAYRHAVSCSALLAAFGRQLGFEPGTIVSLAAGGLLMDIGMHGPAAAAVVAHAGPLDERQTLQMRNHVEVGMAVLARARIVDQDVRDVVRHHHERYDGSGYPRGLRGLDIPLAARMAAIVDCYHAMCSPRPYRQALSHHQALRRIYAGRRRHFQEELVEQFLACLGVYPTGSLVELSSGEVAIVMAQNPVRRLQPQVAVLTGPDKQLLAEFVTVDLMQGAADGIRRDVVDTLPAGSYGIDPAEYFLS